MTKKARKAAYMREYMRTHPEARAKASLRLSTPEAREKSNERARKWREKDPARVARLAYQSRLKTDYGLTFFDYQRMRCEQEDKCAICAKPCDKLYVDHNHETKEVRGLLCQKCNSGLGMLQDKESIVMNALKYLQNPPVSL